MRNDCYGCGGESIQDALLDVAPDLPTQPTRRTIAWGRLGSAQEKAILTSFLRWTGTPYMPGQRARKIGCDCVQLIAGLLDDLYRRPVPTEIPRLPAMAAMHDARSGFRTVIRMKRAYGGVIVRGMTIEPGDVIVTRASIDISGPRRPGHVLMAGVRPFTALHAINDAGVVLTSVQAIPGLLRVYRPANKESWK